MASRWRRLPSSEIPARRQPPNHRATLDATTLEVSDHGAVLHLTTCYPMPVHEAQIERAGRLTQPGVMVSNGPFLLKAVTINGPIELLRNPHYWDVANVRLKAVTHYPLPDAAAATSRFMAGDLDMTDRFQMEDYGWLRASLGEQVRLYFGTVMLGMNTQRPPFNSLPRVARCCWQSITNA
jgi:oligopeptide transport system substrate-binding protein